MSDPNLVPVWECRGLTPMSKLVFVCLAVDGSWLDTREVAAEVGIMSRRHVRRSLASLERRGMARRVDRGNLPTLWRVR